METRSNNPFGNPPPKLSWRGFSFDPLWLLAVVILVGAAAAAIVVMDCCGWFDEVRWVSKVFFRFGGAEAREGMIEWRAVGGAVVGLLLGIGIGATRPRIFWAVLAGGIVGAAIGAFAGGFLLDPVALPVTLLGTLILILAAAVGFRRRFG